MRFSASIARACAALALFAVSCAEPVTGAPAAAATPSLLWANARSLVVICLVQSATTPDAAAVQQSLCTRVSDLAGRGSPFPVKVVEAGDPALVAADTVALLIHASVERTTRGRVVAFTLRPHRASDGDEILFGTSPRAVELVSPDPDRALDSALREALSDILPWQRPSGLDAKPL